jgi:hypothetical protein
MFSILVKNVALARKRQSILQEDYNKQKALFDEQTAQLRNELKLASDDTLQSENDLRISAIDLWKSDGEKRHSVVQVKIIKDILYKDDEAFLWAKEHHMALMLDKKAFEKIAKVSPMDFVTIEEHAVAAIDSNLDSYLE